MTKIQVLTIRKRVVNLRVCSLKRFCRREKRIGVQDQKMKGQGSRVHRDHEHVIVSDLHETL